ncbi:MAG: hypothetical protein O3A47_10565 [Chloroflexi bacterium]|nr:hypothetical protein [Chloroflexota bacterium]
MKAKFLIGTVTAVVLVFSIVGVALGQEAEEDARQGHVGTVSDYDPTSGVLVIDIQDATSTQVSVTVTEETKIKVPGRHSDADEVTVETLDQVLEDGVTKVVVLADSSGVAIHLMLKPGKPIAPPVTGAVTSKETDADGVTTLTITRPDGTTKTVRLGRGSGAIEIGEIVTTFAGGDDEDGGGPPEVKGLVRAEEVKARLNRFVEELSAESDDDPRKGRALRDLADTLESFSAKRVEVLEAVRARAPAAAQRGLENALSRAQRGQAEAKTKASEARAKAGPPEGRGRPGTRR